MKPENAPKTQPRGVLPQLPAYDARMRSCLRCGRHRLMAQMQTKRLLGRKVWVCAPACEPAQPRPSTHLATAEGVLNSSTDRADSSG